MSTEEMKDEVICMRCGMEKSQWSTPEGVGKNEQTYCCSGCSDNSDCICGEETQQELGQRGFGRGAETGGVNPGQQTGQTPQVTEKPQQGQGQGKGGNYPPHGQTGDYPGRRQGGDQPGGQPGGGW